MATPDLNELREKYVTSRETFCAASSEYAAARTEYNKALEEQLGLMSCDDEEGSEVEPEPGPAPRKRGKRAARKPAAKRGDEKLGRGVARDIVLQRIKKHPGTAAEVAEATGIGKPTVRAALLRLCELREAKAVGARNPTYSAK